ncbi:MAG: exonuclease domain-containing protein [Chloroflexota bacterium]|nr:exonuclease domain-containing protein [Chloroflexota bacterium]
MHGDFTAFDLETTGLDAATDEIIEIGIACFRDGALVDQYQRLVKPSVPIPPEITQLTGIDQEDVEGAPGIQDILPELAPYFGGAPLVAHNAGFDVAFLGKHLPLGANLTIDTFELASIVLPSAARYNLGSLARETGITLDRAHRAFDDALATGRLYWQLWEKLCELPTGLLSEIIHASSGMAWDLREVFQAALAEGLRRNGATTARNPFKPASSFAPPLSIAQAGHRPLAPAAVDQVFAPNGGLAKAHAMYEQRDQQLQMAQEVTRALNHGERLMLEAGTGTGKSIAYLLPAALWALSNGQRVTVSTHTINLQEQLLNKDIAVMRQIVGKDLRAALMKGRGNYLCPRRLGRLRRRGPATVDELRSLAKILVWLEAGASGDRGEISLRAGEWAVWSRLSAQDENCTTFRCANEMDGACPYYRARKKAETAHILITNHALLIADARVDNRALPAYHNLIVDEAHQLEDAITNGLSRRIDQQLIMTRLRDLGNTKRGALGAFLAEARDRFPQAEADKLAAFIVNISEAVDVMKVHARLYFRALHEYAGGRGGGQYAKRLLPSQRESGKFAPVQSAWKQLASYFLAVTDAVEHLCQALPHYEKHQMPDFADHSSEIRAIWRSLADLHEQLEHFTNAPEDNAIYAITPGDSPERLQTHISPLHVGPMMEQYLNQRMESIILTSATLTTQGNFDHITERLYTDDYRSVALDSPFNYRQSTLVYIPQDIPEPGRRSGYQRMVERGVIALAAELQGRVMVLFTSYAQLRETSRAVTPRLALGDILVYDQSFGGSREVLLESFKKAEKAVLMGTRSFWEGVDIPGADLSALVIARLPFAVPSDPVFAARGETYSNAFEEYAVPDAILRFRQGFGRLIRSRSDRGVVAIFDSRVISKRYGGSFLESLPDCTVQFGSLENLPQVASNWIDGR